MNNHFKAPAQSRAARALLEMNQSTLAQKAGLGLSIVVDFERERRQVSQDAVLAMKAALELAGIMFIEKKTVAARASGFEGQAGVMEEGGHRSGFKAAISASVSSSCKCLVVPAPMLQGERQKAMIELSISTQRKSASSLQAINRSLQNSKETGEGSADEH